MRKPRIRRPRLSYANVASTLALVLAVSMGGAYAHGKIGSALIKDNAVKSRHIAFQHVKTPDLAKGSVATNRIQAKAVSRGKLKPNARSKTVMYVVPDGHDFSSDSTASIDLPPLSQFARTNSTWTVQARSGTSSTAPVYTLPASIGDTVQYRVFHNVGTNRIRISKSGAGTGHNFAELRIFRTQYDVVGGTGLTSTRGSARDAR